MSEREDGWLKDVVKAASARIDNWPEWKKTAEQVESIKGLARESRADENEHLSNQDEE